MRNIKIGVIGAGLIGRKHLRKLAEHGDYDLVGIADVNVDQVSTEHPKTRVFADYRQLLDEARPEAVIIASPNQQAVGGNIFYVPRLNESKPGYYENKLEFTKLYNGACTRLGEKEINAFANDFIGKIRSNGELAKIYPKWMNNPLPAFPDSIPGIPFTVS